METTLDDIQTYPRLAMWLGRVIDGCIMAAVFFIPLFFIPTALDPLEIHKQTLLILLVVIGILAWFAQAMALRRISVSHSWLHLVVGVFFIGHALTAVFSQDRYLSFVGTMGQMSWAFITIAAFALLYFLIVNTVRTTTRMYHLVLVFLAGSCIVGVIGFFQLLGVFPFAFLSAATATTAFNTIGTIHALAVYMSVPLILAASLMVLGCKDKACILGQEGKKSVPAKILVWATIIISLVVIIAIDYWVGWIGVVFGTILLVVIPLLRRQRVDHPVKVIIPCVLVGLSLLLLLFRTPLHLPLPGEVAPSLSSSWTIAKRTLEQHPLFGSGPGTWVFDYANYHSASVNMSEFWTVRFDRSLTTFFTLIATLGLIGTALWILLLLSGIVKSASHLVLERNDDTWQAYLTLFTGWATVTFLAFFYNYTLAQHFVFWMLLALLAARVSPRMISWDVRSSIARSAILSCVFLVLVVSTVSTTWLVVQRVTADVAYSRSIDAFHTGVSLPNSIDNLETAIRLNRWNDAYYRNASQAYLLSAANEMQGTPDAERAKRVNTYVTSAVDLATKATERSPANVDNWANLGVVLRSIAPFTKGADERAIAMFEEAAKREPNNPNFPNEIGKLHLLRSDAFRQLAQSKDESVRKDAEQHAKDELDKAAEVLNQSIQMKADFAEAHYNLGLVYERQGRVKDAILKLEQVLRSNSKDVGVAFQLSILYFRNNEKDKALNVLEQIIAFDPTYANARWYVSVIYEERARYNEALAQVIKISEQYPENQNVKDRMIALTKLRDDQAKPPVAAPLPEPVAEAVKTSR